MSENQDNQKVDLYEILILKHFYLFFIKSFIYVRRKSFQ